MAFRYDLAKFIPFRDLGACERVRQIRRENLCEHPEPTFRIRLVDDPMQFYNEFAVDIVQRIRAASEENRPFVGIFPVGPMPQYALAAEMINRFRISMRHVYTFNMDEYADQDGNTAPEDWPGSFQRAMMENFFLKIHPDLRPPLSQIHFPTRAVIDRYSAMIAEAGGAEVCYGGIGWCGHIAFWEAHLGANYSTMEEYRAARAQCVELHPMTIMQNALHSFGGDWSWVPPKANTIGPADILSARHRSFWLDGDLGGGVSWQRFIARLVAHGPVNQLVPGSILQTVPTDYTILGSVADNVEVHMA
ncbi:MAG TPA: hypothetical protein VFJ58_30335 [Armatimonadota bacterium]|nr:hypothetical protein [Armatimonadota bacterium]